MKLEYDLGDYVLRALDETYTQQVLDFYSRNQASFNQYETDKPVNFYTKEYISLMLNAEFNGYIKGNYIRFYLYKKDIPDSIIATCSFSHIHYADTKSCNIGYKVDSLYHNRGIATTLVSQCVKIMCEEKGLHRFDSYILPTNAPSLRVMEKLGWIDEGIAYKYAFINGTWKDHKHFVYINN